MSWLFDTDPFTRRWDCGTGWEPWLAWLYIIAQAAIMFAYWFIPACATYYIVKRTRKVGKFHTKKIVFLFASFIFMCGVTHMTEVLVFRWPAYRFYTVLIALTAVISLVAAWHTPGAVRFELKRPTVEEWNKVVDALNLRILEEGAVRAKLEQDKMDMRQEIHKLAGIIQTEVWLSDKKMAIDEMQKSLATLRETVHGLGN